MEEMAKAGFGSGYNMSGASTPEDTAAATKMVASKRAMGNDQKIAAPGPLKVNASAMNEAGPTRNKSAAMTNKKINEFNARPAESYGNKIASKFKATAQNEKTGNSLRPKDNSRRVSGIDLRNPNRDNLQGIEAKKPAAQAKQAPAAKQAPGIEAKKPAAQAEAKGQAPTAQAQAEAKKAPTKPRSAFGQKFDAAKKLRMEGGKDTFKFTGKDGVERSYHSYDKKDMDVKGSRANTRFKSTPEQKAAYKQKIASEKQAPVARKEAVRPERKAPAKPTTRQEKQNAEMGNIIAGDKGRQKGYKSPSERRDSGRTNKFGPGPGATTRADRREVMANRNQAEDVIDAGNRTVTNKDGRRTVTDEANIYGGKPRTSRQAKMLRDSKDGQERFRSKRTRADTGYKKRRQEKLSRMGVSDNQMANRRADRNSGDRALYERNKPSRREMQRMTRSEDNSMEKLAKFVEKQDDLKKNND